MPEPIKIIPVDEKQRMDAQINALKEYKDKQPTVGGAKRGRKSIVDDDVVLLLLTAFSNGLDSRSAFVYAGIGKTAFYKRYNEDQDFADTMDLARNSLKNRAMSRISKIIDSGDERVAGPLAWKIAERTIPELYGPKQLQPNGVKPGQGSFQVLNNEQISDIAKQPDISAASPSELFDALEAASNVDDATERGSAPQVHTGEVSDEYSTEGDLSGSPSTI